MVKTKMYKEREMIVSNYSLYSSEVECNSVYLVCDAVSVWVNNFKDLADLDRIMSHDIRDLIAGAASEVEYDALVSDIEYNGGYIDHRGNFVKI